MEYYTIPLKTCTNCNRLLPSTSAFFPLDNRNKNGLQAQCKVCRREYRRKYFKANPEKKREEGRKYREKYPDKVVNKRREYRLENKDKVAEISRKYYKKNKVKINAYKLEYNRAYRQANPERIRGYFKANPEKYRIKTQRYRARKRGMPDTFTPEQWIACLEYHNYCCAVCGNQLRDLFGNVPHADHWVAITNPDCPGTVAENMICLCSFCNPSKSNRNPEEWLTEKYGTRKANEILKRVAAYFEWASKRE